MVFSLYLEFYMHYVHTLTIIMRNSLQKYYFYLYKRMFFACFLKENYISSRRDWATGRTHHINNVG